MPRKKNKSGRVFQPRPAQGLPLSERGGEARRVQPPCGVKELHSQKSNIVSLPSSNAARGKQELGKKKEALIATAGPPNEVVAPRRPSTRRRPRCKCCVSLSTMRQGACGGSGCGHHAPLELDPQLSAFNAAARSPRRALRSSRARHLLQGVHAKRLVFTKASRKISGWASSKAATAQAARGATNTFEPDGCWAASRGSPPIHHRSWLTIKAGRQAAGLEVPHGKGT